MMSNSTKEITNNAETPLKQIPKRQLGSNGPFVSAIGFGSMGIGAFYGKTDEEEAFKTLTYAADKGVTFWDCADIYGTSEATLGKWFTQTGRRSSIFLASKFGARALGHDGHMLSYPCSQPSYIRTALERSLAQLQTSYIDLYYQHRPDPDVPIEVVLETLRPYIERGTVQWVGLSECSVRTLRRARAVPGIGEKVIAAQMEFSPFSLDHERSGFIPAAREMGVSLVAYSPLSRGLVTGKYRSRADFEPGDLRLGYPRFSEDNFPKNLLLVDKLKALGEKYGATSSQIALAWILAEYPDSFPIPGSRTVTRLEENAAAAELKLSESDVHAVRRLCEEVQGERYPIHYVQDGECIDLVDWKGERTRDEEGNYI